MGRLNLSWTKNSGTTQFTTVTEIKSENLNQTVYQEDIDYGTDETPSTGGRFSLNGLTSALESLRADIDVSTLDIPFETNMQQDFINDLNAFIKQRGKTSFLSFLGFNFERNPIGSLKAIFSLLEDVKDYDADFSWNRIVTNCPGITGFILDNFDASSIPFTITLNEETLSKIWDAYLNDENFYDSFSEVFPNLENELNGMAGISLRSVNFEDIVNNFMDNPSRALRELDDVVDAYEEYNNSSGFSKIKNAYSLITELDDFYGTVSNESLASTAAHVARDYVEDKVKDLGEYIDSKVESAKETAARVVHGCKSWISDKLDAAGQFLEQTKDSIVSGVTELRDGAVELYNDAVDKAKEGWETITNGWQSFLSLF